VLDMLEREQRRTIKIIQKLSDLCYEMCLSKRMWFNNITDQDIEMKVFKILNSYELLHNYLTKKKTFCSDMFMHIIHGLEM